MSAFLCTEDHIGAMVKFWWSHESLRDRSDAMGVDEADWRELFHLLTRENVRSLAARYGDLDGEERSGRTIHKPLDQYQTLTPVSAIKQCHCYAYQTCEHDEWERSDAKRIVDQIEACAIRELPGYEEAPWGL